MTSFWIYTGIVGTLVTASILEKIYTKPKPKPKEESVDSLSIVDSLLSLVVITTLSLYFLNMVLNNGKTHKSRKED